MSAFVPYSEYFNEADLDAITAFLETKNISFEVEKQSAVFDRVYFGEPTKPLFFLKVKADQVDHVNQLLKEEAANNLHKLPADYYLFQFTNEELINLLKEPTEWSQTDQVLAEKLLKERGVQENTVPLEADIATVMPERLKSRMLWAGYGFAFGFPLLAIVVGIGIIVTKKRLPDGTRAPLLDKWSHNHGFAMAALGIVVLATYTAYFLRDHF